MRLWSVDSPIKRRLQSIQRFGMGQIRMQRRDRNIAIINRPQIRALRRIGFCRAVGEPEVMPAARMLAFIYPAHLKIAVALAGDLHAFNALNRGVRKVDRQDTVMRPTF